MAAGFPIGDGFSHAQEGCPVPVYERESHLLDSPVAIVDINCPEPKKPYEKPSVEACEVMEQAALSCLKQVCPNPWMTVQMDCTTCGYTDS